MKKLLCVFVAVLAMAAAATGPARAQSNSEQLFYTLDGTQTGGSSTYYQSSEITQGGISWWVTGNTTMNPWCIGGNNLNGDRDIYGEGSLDETITKVSFDFGTNNGVTVNSITMFVASDADFADIIEQKTVSYSANSTVDVTPGAGFEWTNAYYMFTFNVTVSGSSNKYFRLNAIRFYYDPNASGSSTPAGPQMRTLTGVPQGWQVQAGDPLTVVDSNADGSYSIEAGQPVLLVPSAEDKPRVKSVTLEDNSTPAAVDLEATTTAWTDGSNYAVPAGGLTYSDAVTVSGNVTLTLTEGTTLTLNKGISLAEGATLTVEGTGTMAVNGTNNSTASTVAGSGTLVLTSGTLTAKGGNGQSLTINDMFQSNNTGASGGVAINGNMTVSGGTVTATGGNGGNLNTSAAGGTFENHGGNGGAAISGSVTVNAGGWTATDGSNGSYTGDPDDGYCSAGAGGKAVAGTVTDNR